MPAMECSVVDHQITRLECELVHFTIFARVAGIHLAIQNNGKIDAVRAVHPVPFFAGDHSWGTHIDRSGTLKLRCTLCSRASERKEIDPKTAERAKYPQRSVFAQNLLWRKR